MPVTAVVSLATMLSFPANLHMFAEAVDISVFTSVYRVYRINCCQNQQSQVYSRMLIVYYVHYL
jgi:hypothetical protein